MLTRESDGLPLESTRLCRACRMPVSAQATRCRFCGKELEPLVKPERRLTTVDLGGDPERSQQVRGFGSIARDLTEAALRNELSPTYGREREIAAVLRLLSGESRKSVLIVGEDGVGKTKLVHGIASSLATATGDDPLSHYRLLELDGAAMQSQTVRVMQKIEALVSLGRTTSEVIIFADDAVSIVQPQLSVKSPDGFLGNAIRSGELRCLCALSNEEYARLIQETPSILEDFEVVLLEPLPEDATRRILAETRPSMERKHGVAIDEEALEETIRLTQQYMPKRPLPGKAIAVLDQACARYRRKLQTHSQYPQWSDEATMRHLGKKVQAHDVKRVVTEITSIDIDAADAEAWQRKLDQRLKRLVLGQDAAVSQIAAFAARMRLRFGQSGRPAGVVLLGGPSGVGKRHAIATLTQQLLGSCDDLAVFDMKEFSRPEAVARLFNLKRASGTESVQLGPLAEAVISSSFAVVVFDGVQHAHPVFFDALLPVLRTGTLRETSSNEVSLRRCLFVLTLDCPSPAPAESHSAESLKALVRSSIRPEILQEIEAFILFGALSPTDIRSIIRLAFENLYKQLRPRQIGMRVHESTYELIADQGLCGSQGMTHLPELMKRLVVDPLERMLERGEVPDGTTLDIVVQDDQVAILAGQ
ncbi:MAG TPA: AAA family ATPase [Candidatus Hydrogenedentes bacterium]|nr:AAA family ATPase [Candidatus Hydrogenedentota bacterium]HPG70187.1 AAA family ATPase [Candidatus Hydrogenedentota bacterium]